MPKIKHNVYFLLFSIFLLAISYSFYEKPLYNWDLIPYTALALQSNAITNDSLHQLTYQKVKEQIPEKDFKLLTDSVNQYRNKTFTNSKIFYRELVYYKVKPLYIKAVSFFYGLGFPIVIATVLPSIVSYFLIGLLVFIWLRKYYPPLHTFCISLLISLLPFMLWTARTSSPDMLNALFILTGCYFLIEKEKIITGILLLFLSVFIRPDSILIFSLLLLWLFLEKKISSKIFSLILLASIGCMLAFIRYGEFDLELLFVRQSASNRLAGLGNLTALNYLSGLLKGLNSLLYSSIIFLFLFLLTVELFQKSANSLAGYFKKNMLSTLLLFHIFLLYMIIQFIEDRFIVADYVLLIIISLMQKIKMETTLK